MRRQITPTSKHIGKRLGDYRSRQEADLAENLKSRGVAFGYETVKLKYTVSRRYTPDFELPNGILVEFKGWFKPCDRSKMLDVRDANPDRDIRLVFQNPDARLSKKSATTYRVWAEKHGFKWAKQTVPDSWIKETNES